MTHARDDKDLKARFAREWVRRPNEPFKIAFQLIPDVTAASQAATAWQSDPEVLAEVARIHREEPQAAALPTKEEVARKLIEMAEDVARPYAERLAAYKQYNEIMGFIVKPGTTNNVTVPVINRVLKTKEWRNVDAWEAASVTNQRKLVADADAPATQH